MLSLKLLLEKIINNCINRFIRFIPNLSLILTPLIGIPILVLNEQSTNETKCLYLIIIMAILWSLNPIPLPITSMLPIVMLPLLGLATTDIACSSYLRANNMLFLACLTIALAIEKSNFHQRIALKVLSSCCQLTKFHWMLLGFMMITMFFSMWIVSTATVAMMLPIMDEILRNIFTTINNNDDDDNNDNKQQNRSISNDNNGFNIKIITNNVNDDDYDDEDEKELKNLMKKKDKISTLFYLCIAYSATIGGVSTLTSNGPNLIMKDILENHYHNQDPVDYASYLLYSTPVNIIICLTVWLIFSAIYLRDITISPKRQTFLRKHIMEKYQRLGSMTFHEWAVVFVFILMILLYTFYKPPSLPGWSQLFPPEHTPKLASAAILCVILLFLIPNHLGQWNPNLQQDALLDWHTMQTKLEWSVLIIRGGGFALADAVESSGLSKLVGAQLSHLGNILPLQTLIAIIIIVANWVIEVMRTSATASIMIPVAIKLSENLHINPLKIILPLTASCSYAFISPVGTTSNTLIFYHAKLSIKDMIIPGFIAKTISISMLLLNTWLFGNFYFAIDDDSSPSWTTLINNNPNIDDDNEISKNFHLTHHNMDLIYPLGVFDNITTTIPTTTL
uniref:Solute carrier family 13 member 5-like n=1 Tax=Dermatophagoides pteronyssinus TaxID=6956 RepID=A0A6P6XL48_DERPT|nr:solute carrier family 13 member 5-like [Dermatophagoides pteronyssinus]